jgi:arylsulfatase A-like enzyme
MLRAPGVAPAIDSTAVSLLDVLPTFCALADLDCADDLDGARLPRTGGDDDPSRFSQRTLYAASAPVRSRYRCPWLLVPGIEGRVTMALAGQRKLIRIPTPTGPAYRAYDLAADPAEAVDRFDAKRLRVGADPRRVCRGSNAAQRREAVAETVTRELRRWLLENDAANACGWLARRQLRDAGKRNDCPRH